MLRKRQAPRPELRVWLCPLLGLLMVWLIAGAGSELESAALPYPPVPYARTGAPCARDWVEPLHGIGARWHRQCSFEAGLIIGKCDVFAPYGVMRIRGGFKAKWGEKYMPGLGKKRKGPSATQRKHNEQDRFIQLFKHKEWAAKEQEMHRLIASGDLAGRADVAPKVESEPQQAPVNAAPYSQDTDCFPAPRRTKASRALRSAFETLNASVAAGDQEGALNGSGDVDVDAETSKSRRGREVAGACRRAPGHRAMVDGVGAPQLDMRSVAERAMNGDATAQVLLGESFFKREQAFDVAMALACFQQALSQGSPGEARPSGQGEGVAGREDEGGHDMPWTDDWEGRCYYGVGVCLKEGCGSQEQAIDAFERAAAAGHVVACLELGLWYLGRPMPTHRREAMMPYMLNHSSRVRRVAIPDAHSSDGSRMQATADVEEEDQAGHEGLQGSEGEDRRPQNLEMAAQALKRGAQGTVSAAAGADYARYCQAVCKFEFGVMLLRQQVVPELADAWPPCESSDYQHKNWEQEDRSSQGQLGRRQRSSEGQLERRERGVALIKSAALSGIAEAQFALALVINPPHVDASGASVADDTKALLGISSQQGAEAIRWLRRAALQGHRQAANNLALHYLLLECKGKERAAFRWLRIAARSGLAEGMLNLAKGYADDSLDSAEAGGGPRGAGRLDERQRKGLALKWCRRAARAECPEALLALGRFYKKGLPPVLAIDAGKAVSHFRAAARRGCLAAALELGSSYYAGEGVETDFQKAFEWFQHGAKGGDLYCMFRLAELYDAGVGVKKNKHAALGWYNKGALAMQMRNVAQGNGPPRGGFSEMATWGALEEMVKRKDGGGGEANVQEHDGQGVADDAEAEREKFEAWCKISTPKQIALFHKIQADLDAKAWG